MAHEEYSVGDIVNDHVLIGEEWVPVRQVEQTEDSAYAPGDVVNGHVWTGTDWVTTRAGKPVKKPGFSQRVKDNLAEAERKAEAKRIESGKPPLSERLEAKADEVSRKLEQKARQAEEKAQKLEEGRSRDEHFDQCGRVVAEGRVANRQVRIYEKAYVRIGTFRLGEPERLLGISASEIAQQKTGLGRAVGATVTLGANLLLSPNKRGSLYLVIVTDKKTHNLTASPPTNSDLKAMHKLEGAGRSVLAALETQRQVSASEGTPAAGLTLAEQLTQLTELHTSGALSDEEFAMAKAQLLGSQ